MGVKSKELGYILWSQTCIDPMDFIELLASLTNLTLPEIHYLIKLKVTELINQRLDHEEFIKIAYKQFNLIFTPYKLTYVFWLDPIYKVEDYLVIYEMNDEERITYLNYKGGIHRRFYTPKYHKEKFLNKRKVNEK